MDNGHSMKVIDGQSYLSLRICKYFKSVMGHDWNWPFRAARIVPSILFLLLLIDFSSSTERLASRLQVADLTCWLLWAYFHKKPAKNLRVASNAFGGTMEHDRRNFLSFFSHSHSWRDQRRNIRLKWCLQKPKPGDVIKKFSYRWSKSR